MIGAARPVTLSGIAVRHLSLWPVGIWLVLVVSALIARPPLSPAESQPLSLAWRMWLDGGLLPADGSPTQPPLLFWLIHFGWTIFGVSEVWARLVVPLTALAALLLLGLVARLVWPDRPETAPLASIALVGSGGFVAFSSLTLPETPLLLWTVLGLYGVALAWRDRPAAGWALLGVSLGLGLLMNGPAVLPHLLPLPLLAPLWAKPLSANGAHRPRWAQWYAGLALATLLGLGIGLAWLIPSGAVANLPRLGALFAKPWLPRLPDVAVLYWFPVVVPLLLYPWLWWRTLWRAARRQFRPSKDEGLRFCVTAAAVNFAAAAVAGMGHIQDLLPVLPALALIAARLLSARGGKPKDFHAIIPGLLLLLVGLILFLLNIVPVAHLDAVWREFVGEGSLPIWLGGISLVSGLVLLGGGYLLAQMTPRGLFSRTIQLALLPVLLVTTLNIEFLFSLRRFFDLKPVAEQIQTLQQQGTPVAVFGRYHGEFDFSGRLEQPLTVLETPEAVLNWASAHDDGVIVSYFRGSVLRLPGQPLTLGIVGNSWTALWSAKMVRATDGAALQPRF